MSSTSIHSLWSCCTIVSSINSSLGCRNRPRAIPHPSQMPLSTPSHSNATLSGQTAITAFMNNSLIRLIQYTVSIGIPLTVKTLIWQQDPKSKRLHFSQYRLSQQPKGGGYLPPGHPSYEELADKANPKIHNDIS